MVRKMLVALLVILICAPDVADAQSKPKRDTSKDKIETVTQQRAQAKKTNVKPQPQQKTVKPRRKTNVASPQSPKYATYLKVNQFTSINKRVSSQAGTEVFNISTDGKDWSVIALPSWCRVTKFSDRFILSYEPNTSHDDRADWFKVRCDNQEVRVDIIQQGVPLNITSKFNYAYLQHSFYLNGDRGKSASRSQWLGINANVTIKGAKNQKCLVVAFIADENGKNIKATSNYSSYGLPSSNDVFVATEVVPQSDDAQTFNVKLNLPKNSMRLWKKKNKLRCYLAVYCEKTSSYVSGASYVLNFKAISKNGKVTTKKM